MKEPVFIIGCPRSGTTYLLQVLGALGNFAYVSGQLNRSPDNLALASGPRAFHTPFFGIRRYIHPDRHDLGGQRPVEPWNFWNHHIPHFQWKMASGTVPANLTADSITDAMARHCRESVAQICTLQHRQRFLCKYTDFPRIAAIRSIFPDARFIHLLRDGRAVASSYKEKIDRGDFNTWNEREMWAASWPEAYREDFLTHYPESRIAFVAYQWKNFVRLIAEESQILGPDELYLLRYSDLTDGKDSLRPVCGFMGVGYNSRIRRFLAERSPDNRDHKWREKLSAQEVDILERIIDRPYHTFG